jgi:hypothetical protein
MVLFTFILSENGKRVTIPVDKIESIVEISDNATKINEFVILKSYENVMKYFTNPPVVT